MCVTTAYCEIAGGISPTDGAGKLVAKMQNDDVRESCDDSDLFLILLV